jgi:hypothetical protein
VLPSHWQIVRRRTLSGCLFGYLPQADPSARFFLARITGSRNYTLEGFRITEPMHRLEDELDAAATVFHLEGGNACNKMLTRKGSDCRYSPRPCRASAAPSRGRCNRRSPNGTPFLGAISTMQISVHTTDDTSRQLIDIEGTIDIRAGVANLVLADKDLEALARRAAMHITASQPGRYHGIVIRKSRAPMPDDPMTWKHCPAGAKPWVRDNAVKWRDQTSAVPRGWDTCRGYLAKYEPDTMADIDDTPAALDPDDEAIGKAEHQFIQVKAPEVLQRQGVIKVKAWPLAALKAYFDGLWPLLE